MSSLDQTVNEESVAVTPRVFISYSWTTLSHKHKIVEWAERLLSDGVDVVLDVFDLKEGNDKYHFMERMVTDKALSHVLVFSDRDYADKADKRKAGVGTESQIISQEVYGKVDQSKFIPIICEFDQGGEPYLPVFLQSRIWLDFSSAEAVNQHWEQLIRLLHGKPAFSKPPLGKPPAYLSSNHEISSGPAAGKLIALKNAVLSKSINVSAYREDFLNACLSYADALRVRQDPGMSIETFAQKILEDSKKLKLVRDQIVDWVLFEAGVVLNETFCGALLTFLEKLRELKCRPEHISAWNDSWFEAHSVFVYQMFLYIVAALLRTNAFDVLHQIFTSHYLKPASDRYSKDKFESFVCFYGSSKNLQFVLAPKGQRLYSPAAELIKQQADRTDLPFLSIQEAELLTLMMAMVTPNGRWYPATLHYSSYGDFPFFVRATQHRNFINIVKITGVATAEELRILFKQGEERLNMNQWHDFWMSSRDFWGMMNMDNLDTLK